MSASFGPNEGDNLEVSVVADQTRVAALEPVLLPDIDDDWQYNDDDHEPRCTVCDGEIWVECDDPIQCTYPDCDGELHPDPACGGTGLAEHQVLW